MNNSAAVMVLLKVIDLSHPTAAYILALANSFGGSLIIIGSVSNILVAQQAHTLSISIRFSELRNPAFPQPSWGLIGLNLLLGPNIVRTASLHRRGDA
jgi:hypothetical protein